MLVHARGDKASKIVWQVNLGGCMMVCSAEEGHCVLIEHHIFLIEHHIIPEEANYL